MTSPARVPLSPAELRREGWEALTRALGPADAIRFMMQYDPGRGDYTEERTALFADLTIDEALAEARRLEAQRHSG